MNLPLVMPSNLIKQALVLEERYPKRMGVLISPSSGWCDPSGLPFALDNGKYAVWSKKKKWDDKKFLRLLLRSRNEVPYPPLWVVVPDVVANAKQTIIEWGVWAPRLAREWGFPLALAAQDGMTVQMVKELTVQPDVIFVGGTTEWKWKYLRMWTTNFPRVHVGRVNTGRMLWMAHRAGVESTDGTGWLQRRLDKKMVRYIDRSSRGLKERDIPTLF